jgi:hypothetical protein
MDGTPQWDSYKPYYASLGASALSSNETRDGQDFLTRYLAIRNVILNVSSVLWRRDALLDSIRGLGKDLMKYKMAGDWRLYLEALAQPGTKVADHATPLNVHRRHAGSVTHSLDVERHLEEIERCHRAARKGVELAQQKAVTPTPEGLCARGQEVPDIQTEIEVMRKEARNVFPTV